MSSEDLFVYSITSLLRLRWAGYLMPPPQESVSLKQPQVMGRETGYEGKHHRS